MSHIPCACMTVGYPWVLWGNCWESKHQLEGTLEVLWWSWFVAPRSFPALTWSVGHRLEFFLDARTASWEGFPRSNIPPPCSSLLHIAEPRWRYLHHFLSSCHLSFVIFIPVAWNKLKFNFVFCWELVIYHFFVFDWWGLGLRACLGGIVLGWVLMLC